MERQGFSSIGFSLWSFAPARPKTHKLKHALLKSYRESQRLKSSAAFVPPNPNELDSACCTWDLRM